MRVDWYFVATNCGSQEPVGRLLLCEIFFFFVPNSLVALKIAATEHGDKFSALKCSSASLCPLVVQIYNILCTVQ